MKLLFLTLLATLISNQLLASELTLQERSKVYSCDASDKEIRNDLEKIWLESVYAGLSYPLNRFGVTKISVSKIHIWEQPMHYMPDHCLQKHGNISGTFILGKQINSPLLPLRTTVSWNSSKKNFNDALEEAKAFAVEEAQWRCNSPVKQISEWIVDDKHVIEASARFECIN